MGFSKYRPKVFREFVVNLYFSIKSKSSIIFASSSSIVLYFIYLFFILKIFKNQLQVVSLPLTLYNFLETMVLAPVSEEIIQCFLIFLLILVLKPEMAKPKQMICNWRNYAFSISFILIALGLTIWHQLPFDSMSNFLLFISFSIYGIFYLIYRNLLPPITAHMTWNLMIWLSPIFAPLFFSIIR